MVGLPLIQRSIGPTKILDVHLLPVVAKHFAEQPFIFQDDNAPAHSSKFTRDWKIENAIPGMT